MPGLFDQFARTRRDDCLAASPHALVDAPEVSRVVDVARGECAAEVHLPRASTWASAGGTGTEEETDKQIGRRLDALYEAERWAAARLERLEEELQELDTWEPRARRARLRALQLELHPDKQQPQERGPYAQPLFVRVQNAWEVEAERQRREEELEEQRRIEEEARRRRLREYLRTAAELSRQQHVHEEEETRRQCVDAQPPSEDGGAEVDWEDLDRRATTDELHCDLWEQVHPGLEMDRAELAHPGGLQKVIRLLKKMSLHCLQRALDVIDDIRSAEGWLEAMHSPQLDRLEAEALRQQARYHAQSKRYGEAIWGCLKKAISLHMARGDLYVALARCRLLLHFPPSGRPSGELPPASEPAGSEARNALEDCQEALARDPSLVGAYALALPLLYAQGDLEGAERWARHGEWAIADPAWAAHLAREAKYARSLRAGLEEAHAMLAAEEKRPFQDRRPDRLDHLLRRVRETAGARLEPPFRRQLEDVLKSIGHLQRVQDARAFITGLKEDPQWDDAWGALWRGP